MDDIYKIYGRHTNIGKMMYNVYNKIERNKYKPNVKIKTRPSNPFLEHQQKLKKERQKLRKNVNIDIPKYDKKVNKQQPKILQMRGRKPLKEIQKEMKHYDVILPEYQPIKPRNEKIKELQNFLTFGKKRLNAYIDLNGNNNKNAILKEQNEIKIRMNELLQEMMDRHEFIQFMNENCMKNKHKDEVFQQSIAKMEEFKKLEQILHKMRNKK